MPRPFCQHCQQAVISRPSNLCWHCYYVANVRAAYRATHGRGKRCPSLLGGRVTPAAFRTSARPGSWEKIEVMAQRFTMRQELFHPDDATFNDADEDGALPPRPSMAAAYFFSLMHVAACA